MGKSNTKMDDKNSSQEFKEIDIRKIELQGLIEGLPRVEAKKAFDSEVNNLIINWAKKELEEYEKDN